jgi:hypothetical protein
MRSGCDDGEWCGCDIGQGDDNGITVGADIRL